MKIVSIVGARPQFVKLAPFSMELRKFHQEIIIHTGQHYDINMSEAFFKDLSIPEPDYHLEIGSDTHGKQTGRMLVKLESTLIDEKADLVVVFGDTNSTLAGALAAAKLNIPVLHIEAGLRSFNRQMPEEINRIVTDHIANHLFAPTETAMKNLHTEGLGNKSYLTGDIMVDSLNMVLDKTQQRENLFIQYKIKPGEYYLLTLHRPQNVDNYPLLKLLLSKLNDLDLPVLFPVHPRTMQVISNYEKRKLTEAYPGIIFISPVSYIDFIFLQKNAHKIITDSGGIQKEAFILQIPCATIRDQTEWIETVEAGWNILINPNQRDFRARIIQHDKPGSYPELYGTQVAEKMVALLNTVIRQ